MAVSGVEKYDKLPSRVRFIDVDFMRYLYAKRKEEIKRLKEELQEVKAELDEAVDKFEKKENGR